MRRACGDAGLPAPKLREETEGFWVEFTLGKAVKTPVKTPGETPVEMQVKTGEGILELLRANPKLSLAEVAEALGKSLRAVERACAKLVASGRLRRVGPSKGGHWEVLP